MTLDDLRVYVAVCAAGSLSAVARDLSCTQSAVSQHIRRLEREVGVSLLERHARGVLPTPAGRILQTAAAEGIGGIDVALRRLRDLARGESGAVRVTTGATTVRHFMSEAIVGFRRRHPRASLEFQTVSSSHSAYEALAAHDLDLAWVTIGAPERGVEQRPVVELPWVLAVRPDDPLVGRTRIGPDDTAAAHLIRPPEQSTSRSHLDRHLSGLGITGSAGSDAGVADWATAVHLAELGLGHALVPELPGWRDPDRAAWPGPRPRTGPAAPRRRLGGPALGHAHPAGEGLRRLVAEHCGR